MMLSRAGAIRVVFFFFLPVILPRYPWIETELICGCAEYIHPVCSCRGVEIQTCFGHFVPVYFILIGHEFYWARVEKKGTPTDDLMHQAINK